jgi:hypothetical protein
METNFGLIELVLVFVLFGVGWVVMEWQGKRLDRARAERDKSSP